MVVKAKNLKGTTFLKLKCQYVLVHDLIFRQIICMYILVNTVWLSEMPLNDSHATRDGEGGVCLSGKGVTAAAGRHEKKEENRWLPFAHCIFTETYRKF